MTKTEAVNKLTAMADAAYKRAETLSDEDSDLHVVVAARSAASAYRLAARIIESVDSLD